MSDAHAVQVAQDHFGDARRSAFLHDLAAFLQRHPNRLVPYHEISRRTAPESEVYRGVETIPIDHIVGSVNRFEDFDRRFFPRNRRTQKRWQWVDRAWHDERGLPPIEVIRVGDIYFVKDGNHRVSVARQHGQQFIEAEVVEERLRAPLTSDMSPERLLLQAEYAEFLRRTNLDELRPAHDIRPGRLGDDERVFGQIEAHRRWLEEEYEHRPVGLREAVMRWYDNVYTPIVRIMRDHDIRELYPGRTEADLYLWAMSRRDELYALYRSTRDPVRSAAEFLGAIARFAPRPRWLERLRHAIRPRVLRKRG